MPQYKNIFNSDIAALYEAVKRYLDSQTEGDIPLSEVQVIVDEYLQGQIDKDDLLADIDNELAWIPTEQDAIDTAIALVPAATTAQLKTIMIGILEHDRRILQENLRMLRAWKFMIKNVKVE